MHKQAIITNHLSQPVTRLLTLGLAAGVALSWPLWYAAARPAFPLLPLLGPAQPEPIWLSVLSMTGLLVALLCPLIFNQRKWPLIVLLLTLTLLCVADLNRLQPWIWFYSLVCSVVLSSKDETSMRHTLRWLLAAVYIWSGLHKCTPYFAVDNFAWFCSAFTCTKIWGSHAWIGYAVAVFEMSLGLGLLWPRSRRIFRWLVLFFHGVIILALSPLGLNWNVVVIPWNVVLAALVWFSFAGTEVTALPKNYLQSALLVLAALAPLLQFAGAWPEAFSWKLYSNTQPEATFYSTTGFPKTALSASWQSYTFDHATKLLLDDWANATLGTPMFASDRTFRAAGTYLCSCMVQPDSAGLYILKVQPWNRERERWRKIPCRELMAR